MTHSKACLAKAIICAVENVRDNDNEGWDVSLATADFYAIGLGYLDDGSMTCLCMRTLVTVTGRGIWEQYVQLTDHEIQQHKAVGNTVHPIGIGTYCRACLSVHVDYRSED